MENCQATRSRLLPGVLVSILRSRVVHLATPLRKLDYPNANPGRLTDGSMFNPQTALPVADKLDPFQAYLPYKLFRESTRDIKGKVVKVGLLWVSPAIG
jgi:import inner membrane translocase subunit TIM50